MCGDCDRVACMARREGGAVECVVRPSGAGTIQRWRDRAGARWSAREVERGIRRACGMPRAVRVVHLLWTGKIIAGMRCHRGLLGCFADVCAEHRLPRAPALSGMPHE